MLVVIKVVVVVAQIKSFHPTRLMKLKYMKGLSYSLKEKESP